MKFGEDVSKGMGIDTAKVRNTAMVCTSLLTAAAAVCFTGVIGFIGLVSPHIARMLLGEGARFPFAGSAMIGAILLVTADTIGRSVFAVLAKGKIVCGGSPEEVLTSRLIREVYGVKATVDPDDSGRPCIHYAGLVDCKAAE